MYEQPVLHALPPVFGKPSNKLKPKSTPNKSSVDLPAIEGGSPLRQDFLVFAKPKIEHAEIEEVVQTLTSGWVGRGQKVDEFERAFASFKKTKFAIAVNSCTAALFLSLRAIGIEKGDEVITTPMTYSATINAIIAAGGTPVFADCDRSSFNIDPSEIERKVSSKTRAILPVHLAGRPCDMNAINVVAKKYNLRIVEDCAHAIESESCGKPSGTWGDTGCFSFGATKNIITGGKGGMVITNEEEFADLIRALSTQGQSQGSWERLQNKICKHSPTRYAGFNFEMTDLQASIGIHQLKQINDYHYRRLEIWEKYNRALENLPVARPKPVDENFKHAMHLYTILLQTEKLRVDRDFILEAFTKENIGVSVHYEAQHLQPYYSEKYGYKTGDFPNAEYISERTVSLPIGANLTDQDVEDVIAATKRILNYYKK